MAAPGASETVVVVTGGDPVDPAHLPPGLADATVIAADSGIDRALALGLRVAHAVGDFDSVTAAALDAVTERGATVDRHPIAKDATDLALALDAAVALGPARVVVIGGHGGRLDHLLANALLLADPAYDAVSIVAQMGPARVTVVRDRAELDGPVGDLVSLLPAHGVAIGVTTTGLLYPLADEDLPAGSTRGVSNELTATAATVTVRAGVLLAVQPGTLGTHHQMRTS
jgi:thiamine pyrophosphokinase